MKYFENTEGWANPDFVNIEQVDKKLDSRDKESLSFAYKNNEWIFGSDDDFGKSHRDTTTLPGSRSFGSTYEYHGRLWKDAKILAFWDYPDKKLFTEFLNDLSIRLGEKIKYNNWKIVYWSDDESIEDAIIEPVENFNGTGVDVNSNKMELLKRYHLATGLEKQRLKKLLGFDKYPMKKSNWPKWQKPFESKKEL